MVSMYEDVDRSALVKILDSNIGHNIKVFTGYQYAVGVFSSYDIEIRKSNAFGRSSVIIINFTDNTSIPVYVGPTMLGDKCIVCGTSYISID